MIYQVSNFWSFYYGANLFLNYFNIHNFNNYKTNFKKIENQKLKFNSRKNNNNAKEYLYENNKDSNNINCKNTDNEIENSSNKIKSMLKEIKNMNINLPNFLW